jgi:hypothetical protein
MAKKGFKIPGVSFSAKRALGITKAQQNISRKTGVPLTKAGRQRKVGQALGCMVFIVPMLSALLIFIGYNIFT